MPDIRGVPVPPNRESAFAQLTAFFQPQAGIARVSTYATWLFGGTAVVSALATGLGASSVARLARLGAVAAFLAVGLLGISLACSAWCLAPFWVSVNTDSLGSMQEAIGAQFKRRRILVTSAAVTF